MAALFAGCKKPSATPTVALDYRTYSQQQIVDLLKDKAQYIEVTLKPDGANRFTGQAKGPEGTALPITVVVETKLIKYESKTGSNSVSGTIDEHGEHKQQLQIR